MNYILFYKTKNKLRNRILLTNDISNLIIFVGLKAPNDKGINCEFFLYKDSKNISHLLLRSNKYIKKGDLLNISENDIII